MSKQYKYKGKVIENIPYGSEPRWFICEEDGSRSVYNSGSAIYPLDTLKEAKLVIDTIVKEEVLIL